MWLEFQRQIERPKHHILSRIECSLREWRDIQDILGEQHLSSAPCSLPIAQDSL